MPDEFWELTPAELNLIIEVYSEKQKQQRKLHITAAFYSAYYSRIKSLTSKELENTLTAIDESGEMTDEQMLRNLKKLARG